MPRLLRSLADLLLAWWCADRVRASPREGRLLRLEPGSVLRVAGRPAAVVGRRVGETAEGPYVAYECECESGPAALVVRHTAGLVRSTVSWSEEGTEVRVPIAAVEAYPAARRGRALGASGLGPRPRSRRDP
ncbi:MAG: hypothetical protein HY721_21535 [Planctomycetes bacterium]|nr:hypothetical protein [Planctomycetota bacterium]